MPIYFNIETSGFYDTDSGVRIPEGSILLEKTQYHYFLEKMNHENKKLVIENGSLVLKPREKEINWDIIRAKRNKLLKESDYTQMPDFPNDKQAWVEYRQLLRDIPQIYKTPEEVVWPSKPKK
jgi:phage pi2 protein 07